MQIPKQPRTRSPSAGTSQDDAPSSVQSTAPQKVNQNIEHTYRASVEGIKSAYLDSQKEYLAAYLAFLESLQQAAKANPDPILEYVSDLTRAQSDAHATAEAHRKFVLSHVDRQVSDQKALIDAATAYSQSLRESYAKLEEQVRQHNQSIAEALKEALLKMDVRTGDVPLLALLFQGLRIMSAARPSSAATPG